MSAQARARVEKRRGFPVFSQPLGTGVYDFEGPNRKFVGHVLNAVEADYLPPQTEEEMERLLKEDAHSILGPFLNLVSGTPAAREVLVNEAAADPENDPSLDGCAISIVWDVHFHEDGNVYFAPWCEPPGLRLAKSLGLWPSAEESNGGTLPSTEAGCPFLSKVFDIQPIKSGRWALWPPVFLAGEMLMPTLIAEHSIAEKFAALKGVVDFVAGDDTELPPLDDDTELDPFDREGAKQLRAAVESARATEPVSHEWPSQHHDHHSIWDYLKDRKESGNA